MTYRASFYRYISIFILELILVTSLCIFYDPRTYMLPFVGLMNDNNKV